jgi:hypothetical protein
MLEKYLTESKKVYEFKIGVAGELPEGFEDRLETVMQKFSVASMSTGKKTPIQERPLDFPQLQNTEVTYYEVAVNYPTTVQVLQEYLGKVCSVDQSHIIVRNVNEPQEEYQAEANAQDVYEPKLTTELESADPKAQESVGGERIMNLLKELETARKEREHDPMDGAPAGESKDIGDTENTKSTLGS